MEEMLRPWSSGHQRHGDHREALPAYGSRPSASTGLPKFYLLLALPHPPFLCPWYHPIRVLRPATLSPLQASAVPWAFSTPSLCLVNSPPPEQGVRPVLPSTPPCLTPFPQLGLPDKTQDAQLDLNFRKIIKTFNRSMAHAIYRTYLC